MLEQAFFSPKSDLGLCLMLLLSGSFGIVILLASLITVTVCGPMAIVISGVFKDVSLTYVGFIFFTDATPTFLVKTGLIMSFSGAIYYSYA